MTPAITIAYDCIVLISKTVYLEITILSFMNIYDTTRIWWVIIISIWWSTVTF